MFFDSKDNIKKIAKENGTSLFVLPKDVPVEIKGALILAPSEKSVITIEQVRYIIEKTSTTQNKDLFVIVRPADLLGEAAANAFLKSLEEPGEKVHYLLITDSPSKILPTILSRSKIYFLRNTKNIEDITAGKREKELAKKLIVAKPAELVDLAEEITKKRDGARAYTLEVLEIAIEMLYKSYFLTKKEAFLKKLPKFLKAYEGVLKNGHLRLQIVSNLC